jgi:type VII secretion protein EccB
MQTQRDHVHAHQFMVGRISCALVEGDPSSAEAPGRRALTGVLGGSVIAVLVLAAFGVYGWIVPGGSKAFKEPGLILVEKENGTRYVYLDGVLRPTPDLASALLIQGGRAKVKLISRNSLKGLPRGAAVGVPGAPPNLPGTKDLVRGPWLACLPGSVEGGDSSALGVNLDPAAPAQALSPGPAGPGQPAGQYAVVRAEDGKIWLLAGDHRHRIANEAVLVALGGANARAIPAPNRWLGWIPEGVPLGPAEISGAGDPGPQVGGVAYPVGTVFRQRAESGTEQVFVSRPEGLAPLSRTEFLLLEAAGRRIVQVDTATVAAAPQSPDRSLTTRLPDLAGARWADPAGRVLCLRQQPVTAETYRSAVVFADGAATAVADKGRAGVRVRPGSGMVVLPVPAPKGSKGFWARPTPWFVSEAGVAYPVPDAESLAALKFGEAPPVPFPKDLLAELPQGPALSRDAVKELDGR